MILSLIGYGDVNHQTIMHISKCMTLTCCVNFGETKQKHTLKLKCELCYTTIISSTPITKPKSQTIIRVFVFYSICVTLYMCIVCIICDMCWWSRLKRCVTLTSELIDFNSFSYTHIRAMLFHLTEINMCYHP